MTDLPLDIRAALTITEGLGTTSEIIYGNLLGVIISLLWIFFAFWFGLQAWGIMRGDLQIRDASEKIVKKMLLVIVAVFILESNPAEWFMLIFGGIASIGQYAGDLFLSSATGTGMATSCGEIYNMIADADINFGFLGAENTASVICMTGRITEFFYAAIMTSFDLATANAGVDLLGLLLGVVGVVLFGYCIFKFAFITLGIIVDIMLMLMFLPFVAFTECFKSGWNDKELAGRIMSKIANAFGDEDLSKQIQTFIQAIIYIVAVSLVASLCFLMISGIVANGDPNMIVMLTGGTLCAYMIYKTEKIAEDLGGKINDEWPKELRKNFDAAAKAMGKNIGNLTKMIRKKPAGGK